MRVCVRIGVRAQVRVCARMCVRARVSVHAFVCVRLRMCSAAPSASIFARVRVWNDCFCVPRVCLGGCAGAGAARRGPAVLIARPAAPGRPGVLGCGSVRSVLGVARVGRRCDVDEPYPQGRMGCAMGAHIRDRRRRRHLRHRRQRWLPGRVGEHQRRCAAGLGQRGSTTGAQRGYYGVLASTRGYSGVLGVSGR